MNSRANGPTAEPTAEPVAAPVVRLRGAEQTIGGARILEGVDLEVRRGQIVGLLGPNGAGKSSTVDLVAGLARPTSGTVEVLGVDPAARRDRITASVGVQPQSAALFPTLSVDETLALFSSFHERPVPLGALRRRTGLEDVRRTRVKHLSGGEERRLLIAIALVGAPELVILDEPSTGLDPAIRRGIAGLIRETRDAGATVLMTTHHLDEAAALCDRVAIMSGGRIVLEGSPGGLASRFAGTSEIGFTVSLDTDPAVIRQTVGGAYETREVPGGTRILVRSEDPDALLRRIAFARGLRPQGLSVRAGTLEEAYLAAVAA